MVLLLLLRRRRVLRCRRSAENVEDVVGRSVVGLRRALLLLVLLRWSERASVTLHIEAALLLRWLMAMRRGIVV